MVTTEHLPTESKASTRLLAKVAELYYLEDLTQLQIGQRLGLSRQKVQRLIRMAREKGVVQITIQPIRTTAAELERKLEERFGIQEAVVSETAEYDDHDRVVAALGPVAAEYLTRIVGDGDSIAISWAARCGRWLTRCARPANHWKTCE